MKKSHKRFLKYGLLALGAIFLTACGSTAPITAESTGLWDGVILRFLSQTIISIAEFFGGNYGIGIISLTIIIRTLVIPLTLKQQKSMSLMQEIQPELEALRQKYPDSSQASQEKMLEEQQEIYDRHGVNPMASFLPMIIQMPILIALYQAISRTPEIANSHFLWVNLGEVDPYYILPLLAALITFANTKLTQLATPTKQTGSGVISLILPIFIFFISFRLASAISLYFVVSNLFSVAQTLIFNNPFKKRAERKAKEVAELEAEQSRKKAYRKAKKIGRSVKK